MAKQRIVPNPLAGPVPITPRAAPVDIFHRPDASGAPAQGPSQGLQLANALSGLQPSILKSFDIAHAEASQKELSGGQLQVLKDKRLQTVKGLNDAIARGDIPAAQSPYFRQGMREQAYRLEGLNYDNTLRSDYAQSASKNSDDISTFMQSHAAAYIQNSGINPSDPEAAKIFTPMVEAAQANLFAHHRAERDAQIEQQAVDNTYRSVQAIVSTHAEYPDVTGDPAANIKASIDEMVAHGMNGTQANRAAIDAITDYAKDNLDSAPLDHLDNIDTGNGKLAGTQYARDQRRAAEDHIFSKTEENGRTQHALLKQHQEEATKALLSEGMARPLGSDLTDIRTALLTNNDAEGAHKLEEYNQARINAATSTYEPDPVYTTDLTYRVQSGQAPLEEIRASLIAKKISEKTATKLANDLPRAEELRSVFNTAAIKERGDSLYSALLDPNSDDETSRILAGRARGQFWDHMSQYAKDNPKGDFRAEAGKQWSYLLETYSPANSKSADKQVPTSSAPATSAAPVRTRQEILQMTQQEAAKPGSSDLSKEAAAHNMPVAQWTIIQSKLATK